MRLGSSLPFAVAVTVVCGCAISGAYDRQQAAVAAPSAQSSPAITSPELAQHLRALQRIADRNHGTRAAGTPGYAASADYVAARLEDAGGPSRARSCRSRTSGCTGRLSPSAAAGSPGPTTSRS